MNAAPEQEDADQVTLRHAADEEHRENHRNPDDRLAQVRLEQDQQHGRAADDAAQQQPDRRMQISELAQQDGQHHDAGDDRKLRGLEIDRADLDPAPRAIDPGADEPGQDEKRDARQVHRQRPPFDPAVIDEAGDEEGHHPDADPHGLPRQKSWTTGSSRI